MQSLPLSALRAFEAAARTGSFRAASEELSISPSAVSHAVRKLEDIIGDELFEREGRSVRLNPTGEALYRHVETGFEHFRLGLGQVASRSRHLLRLHCAPSFATQWLMPRLRHFLQANPGLEVRLAADTDYARFLRDETDMDICYGPPRDSGLLVRPLGEEVVTPLCAPHLAKTIIEAGDLLKLSLIESAHKQVRWPAWFSANGIIPPAAHGNRFDRSHMAIAAAVDGMGIALESTRLAEREIARGDLVAPLKGRAQDVTYIGHFLVCPAGVRQRPAVRAFSGWIAAELDLPASLPQ